jgi:hypothetical protein
MIGFPPSVRIVTAVLLLAGVGLSALLGQSSDELGQVLRVRNIVKAKDELGDLRTLKNGKKEPIRLRQEIQTFRDSAVELAFDRDGRLRLWPSTKVELLEPGPRRELPSDCNDREVVARIKLWRGAIQVDHSPARDNALLNPRVLEIVTRDAYICLSGTSIQVYVDPDPNIGTGVFVSATGAQVRRITDKDGWVAVKASQQLFVRKRGKLEAETVPRFTLPGQRGEGRFNDSPLFDPIVFGGQG